VRDICIPYPHKPAPALQAREPPARGADPQIGHEIPPELRELVVEGAEGNPFYLEELIKMLIENGVILKGEEAWQIEPERLAQIEVPPTLAGVLQARLDSLPVEERVVLQQASVVGTAVLGPGGGAHPGIGEWSAVHVGQVLSALRQRELIYRREASAFADTREYIFKHDVAGGDLRVVLKRLRRRYHGLVADWLIENSADRIGEYSGSIAEHLMKAGRVEQAGGYFLKAGQAALASYANAEAEGYFRRALALSQTACRRLLYWQGWGRHSRCRDTMRRLSRYSDKASSSFWIWENKIRRPNCMRNCRGHSGMMTIKRPGMPARRL
jgi:predicted ATPase